MRSCTTRALSLLVLLGLLFVGLLASLRPAHAGSSHPYFDDAGTLVWYTRLADAQRAARAEGKLIFVEFGRRRCGSCKVLCNRILPDPRIRSRLSAVAVGLASECDHPEPAIGALFNRHLRNAHMLPFAAFITADGQWVTGFAGSGRTESFLGHLAKAERAQPQPVRTSHIARQPQPRPVKVVPSQARRRVPQPPVPAPVVTPVPAPSPRPQNGTSCVDPQPVAPPRPPSVDLAEADQAGRTSVSRGRAGAVPPARLMGSPDAKIVSFPPAAVTLANDPSRKARCKDCGPTELPPPTVASIRAGRTGGPAARTPVSKQAAKPRPAASASTKWADKRLDFAADAVAAGRYEEGLTAIEEVLDRMPGEAAFVDAARGLDAIKRLLQQRFLDPDGQVAKAARRMAYEDMWGTRWAKLFD